ncbi:MAG: MucB/RseB C-terminal domain-containing protein [Acidiferrobacter sp.]
MKELRPLLMATLLLASGAVYAKDARAWLQHMEQAAQTVNYTGTFVYRHGAVLSVMHIVHRAVAGQVTERLTALDGRRQVIIRGQGRVACYLPREHVVFIERRVVALKTFPALVPTHLGPLRKFYTIQLGGLARVAGKESRLVVIAPRDAYRYGYRLWADRKTGLLLKASVTNSDHRTIEQFLFTHLRVKSHIPASAVGPIGVGRISAYKEERGELFPDPAPSWTVRRKPPGFHLAMHLMRRIAGHKEIVQHLVYSDGLAGVSVFIGRRPNKESVPPQLFRLGALHIFRSVIDHRMVTVMGDVPTLTVETMALSVRPLATPKRP